MTLRQTCVKSSKGKLTVCSMRVVHLCSEPAIPTFYRFAYSCASALRRGRLFECSSDKECCRARCTAQVSYSLCDEVVFWKAIVIETNRYIWPCIKQLAQQGCQMPCYTRTIHECIINIYNKWLYILKDSSVTTSCTASHIHQCPTAGVAAIEFSWIYTKGEYLVQAQFPSSLY